MGSMKTTGGKKLAAALNKAQSVPRIKEVEVGFFATARYPPVRTGQRGGGKQSPVPVAFVAAIHEFGAPKAGIPERPFFRLGIEKAKPKVRRLVREELNPIDLAVTPYIARRLGETVKRELQQSVTDLKNPPLKARTVERKGSDNPLIDTGFLRQSVAYEVR